LLANYTLEQLQKSKPRKDEDSLSRTELPEITFDSEENSQKPNRGDRNFGDSFFYIEEEKETD